MIVTWSDSAEEMLINDTAGRRSCESMDGFIVHAESELTEVGRRVIKLLSKASIWVVLPRLLFVVSLCEQILKVSLAEETFPLVIEVNLGT